VDFLQIHVKERKNGYELYPVFVVERSIKDLMVRGGSFYAIWDEARQIWSRDELDVQRLVDEALWARAKQEPNVQYDVKVLKRSDSGYWKKFVNYVKDLPDNFRPLDTKLTFQNMEVDRDDYVSKRLPYAIEAGDVSAWGELVSTLYAPEERKKIEWSIGSIISGDSKKIQKFMVFYGSAGTGKSTMLHIIEKLFSGYWIVFEGRALGNMQSSFAMEPFKNNPLVAIEHDSDLSRLDTNTRFNSIVSHESVLVNEKHKPMYEIELTSMLFLGSNQPVKISDSRSGLLRRLIDIHPTGVTFTKDQYDSLMNRINFELGAIAAHCLDVYRAMGPNYYNSYQPRAMQYKTDVFFNFVEAYFVEFQRRESVTLKQAYHWYKEFCLDTGIEKPLPQYKVRDELENYFDHNDRDVFSGFNAERYKHKVSEGTFSLVLDHSQSLFDRDMVNQPAQLATEEGTPTHRWANVTTQLRDLDTSELHYVKVPENHIVIDFDLQAAGDKSAFQRNLEAASQWPPTYAEVSRSGEGIHLHYNYRGDVKELAPKYQDGIEVKTYLGDSALRRRLSLCNAVEVSSISDGLPKKEKKERMLTDKTMSSERGLRELIERNLRKEVHAGTKPSVDFIKKILDDAYESGMDYDVTDLRGIISTFAAHSTNQPREAGAVVRQMKWKSESMMGEEKGDATYGEPEASGEAKDPRIVFFDVEVYPNLFVICWKFQGANESARMVNPTPEEVAELFKLKLVGFYNRRFDNHILWAAALGWPVERLYALSQKMIVDSNRQATFREAYNLSYADVWDFATEKKSLKKWEIDLGLLHMELDLPWDQPVEEKDVERVLNYCVADVEATEALFEHVRGDWTARQILAALSGLTVNDTTQSHTARIVFGDDRDPQRKFVYTDLSEEFPGYVYDFGKSSYRGEDPGEGGYVYSEPGIYENVAVLDIVSMHPKTIEILNLFGPYTENYNELRKARVAIKRQDYDTARQMLGGRLAPFLEGAEADEVGRHGTDLAYALRIALNIVYGLTSARFDNPFRDRRNKDNIVAKRGALYMIDLKADLHAVEKQPIHFKTDSVKLPNATAEDIAFVMTHGSMYQYEFELEAMYEKFCLVNDAVYVGRMDGEWTAIGAQFQHPVVFKTLFTGEELTFEDFQEARSVNKGLMYLDRRGSDMDQPDKTKMRFVGKTGLFVPVMSKGGILYRHHEDKFYAVAGTKGHLWMEAEVAKGLDDVQIDMSYFDKLVSDARAAIEQFGSYDEFIKE
jgi:hypothetical protein